jgi:hypothetical protein
MSDTPRTDSAIRNSGGQWSYGLRETCEQLERELADMTKRRTCEQLERELAEVTEQRDALAEALRTASERFRNPRYGCMWDDAADDIDKTLSAVKGGSDE